MTWKTGLWSVVIAGCCCLALGLPGCNGGGGGSSVDSNIRPAGGHIAMNGTPVAGANVRFFVAGTSGTPAATGTTDESGNFMLTTDFKDDGAAIGTYDVAITTASADGAEPKSDGAAAKPLPEKFATPGTSGLKAEVKAEGENWFAFDLSAK